MSAINYHDILRAHGFVYDKSLGQNFIADANLLQAIVRDAGIVSTDTVLEIGAGAGTLTAVLAQTARSVIAYEIDTRLCPVHDIVLGGLSNASLRYEDFMSVSEQQLATLGGYKVVANLPYYITTPIIFRLLESAYPPVSITIMVQKEVADRIVAVPSTPEYGALSVNVALACKPTITRIVPRTVFVPEPNVDSAVVRLDIVYSSSVDRLAVSRLIKCAFGMRRKTLVNNLQSQYNIPKSQLVSILQSINLDSRVRGEALDVQQYIQLSKLLQEL